MTITLRLLSSFIFCSLLFGTNLQAQSAWLPPTGRSSISVEVYRLDRPTDINNNNGTAVYITARYIRPSGFGYVLELPTINSDKRRIFTGFSSVMQSRQTAIGNPYFGVSYKGSDPVATTYDIGIRLPLTPDGKSHARSIGIVGDVDRLEAFVKDQFSLRALVGRHWKTISQENTGWLSGGATLLYSRDKKEFDVLADLRGGIWNTTNKISYGSSVTARALITEDHVRLSERIELVVGFGINATLGSIRPGMHVRFPVLSNGLFSLGQRINSAFGGDITFLFGDSGNE